MKELFGKIKTSLVEMRPERVEGLTQLINSNIDPPEKVRSEEVYIRAMYIVSDRVNSAGGRFPAEDHAELARLLVDSPVLVGHRKDSLPIARNFHAEPVEKGEERWIKVYFYWLKKAEGAENLKNNIDGGIYKEGSISFIFGFPECGVCGEDIRGCEHRPFKKYNRDGREIEAFFNYRKIFRVLETSLVYRGAVHDTSITGELFNPGELSKESESARKETINPFTRIASPAVLNRKHRFRVRPLYESIPVVLTKDAEKLVLSGIDGSGLTGEVIEEFLNELPIPDDFMEAEGRLIGLRGKERQPVSETIAYLEGKSSAVKRIELRLCREEDTSENSNAGIKVIRCLITDGAGLEDTIDAVKSRLGAEIIDLEDGSRYLYQTRKAISMTVLDRRKKGTGYDYELIAYDSLGERTITAGIHSRRYFDPGDCLELEYDRIIRKDSGAVAIGPKLLDVYGKYRPADLIDLTGTEYAGSDVLEIVRAGVDCYCVIKCKAGVFKYRIKRFDRALYDKSRRFLSEPAGDIVPTPGENLLSYRIKSIEREEGTLRITPEGNDAGTIVIRPAVIKGRDCFLFYRTCAGGDNE